MRKKLFALLLVFVLVFSLAACNKDAASNNSGEQNSSNTSSNNTSNTSSNDTSNNDTSNNNSNSSSSNAPGGASQPDNSAPAASGNPVEISAAFKWMPNGLDPISEDSGYNRAICYHIYDRLVFFDYLDNSMSPCVARSWKKIDGVTWEFEINLDDYVFQNGDKLSMDDVVFSILRIKDIPKTADTGSKIDSVTYNGNILTLKFTEENNTLLSMVLSVAIIVNKAYVEAGGDNAVYTQPIGTGPYKVSEFIPGSTVVIETWGGYLLPKPQIDKISFILSPEDAARYIAVETGQVQYSAWFTPFEMDLAEKNDNLSTYYGESRRFGSICFNCERAPFDNVNVRRALAFAVDRDASSMLQGGARPPMRGVVFNGYSLYREPASLPEYDLAKAKSLLEAEGYNESNPLHFEILTYAPADPYIELYQSVLRSIGVIMDINPIEISTMMALEGAGDFDVEWITPSNRGNNMLVDLERVDYNFAGSRNTCFYYNERVQEIIARMRVTDDQQELNTLNTELNEILGEEVPMIAVTGTENLAAMDKRLSGVTISPEVIYDFRNAVFSD